MREKEEEEITKNGDKENVNQTSPQHLQPPKSSSDKAKHKRNKQQRRQESLEEAKDRVLDQHHQNKVKSIDCDSGSIDMIEYGKLQEQHRFLWR